MKDKSKLNWLIISYLLFVILVLTASINPMLRLNKIKILEIRLDYLLHFLLFIPWMVLAFRRWARNCEDKTIFLLAAGSGLILAGFSEAIQFIIPGRSFSAIDFAADTLGICVGAIFSGWGWGVKTEECIQMVENHFAKRES